MTTLPACCAKHLQQPVFLWRQRQALAVERDRADGKIDGQRPGFYGRLADAARICRRSATRTRAISSAIPNGLTT